MPQDVQKDDPGTGAPRRDMLSVALGLGVFFVITSILIFVLYGLLTGVFTQPAPRSSMEASLREDQLAVRTNPADGKSWGNLAHVLYISGDKQGAWNAIATARRSVPATDNDIIWVNLAQMDLLIRDGKNTDAVAASKAYVKSAVDFLTVDQHNTQNSGTNLSLDQFPETPLVVQLLFLQATAQGNLGQWKDAVASLDSALQLDPLAADILDARAQAKLNAGDKAGAKTDWQKVLTFLPSDQQAQQGLASLSASK